MSDLQRTPLYDLHVELGAKMVPFAGYEMPVQYAMGVMKEHSHTRTKAGLFDVSHMGQALLRGPSYDAAALALEALVPVDVLGLDVDRQRYGFLVNAEGGILDDLMITNRGDHIVLVVNAACKDADFAHISEHLPKGIALQPLPDRALLALQGPSAEDVLKTLAPRAADMRFLDVATLDFDGSECWVSRSGYTGEDGFEISIPASDVEALTQRLLEHEVVEPIGLGARDSLRLEGGLCLCGHDIGPGTTPVEASLSWAIQKTRRWGGVREGGFQGSDIILDQLESGATRRRVGLQPEGRAPMREGVPLFADADSDQQIGAITSGGFGPTVQGPVAMGYVPTVHATPGTTLFGELRGKRLPVTVVNLPFTPANFKR